MADYAGSNNLLTLNGNFKEVYTDKGIENLIPDGKKILQAIKFVKKEQTLGNVFH